MQPCYRKAKTGAFQTDDARGRYDSEFEFLLVQSATDQTVKLYIMNLRAERIYDVGICLGVMDSMWDEISEDGVETFQPDVLNEYWVGIFSDEGLVGIYRIHQVFNVCFQIHAFMMDRAQKESGKVILRWCVENIEEMQKLIAEIPVIYPNVHRFTLNQGFVDEGTNRSSFTKNGELHDVHRLGITRGEIWSVL